MAIATTNPATGEVVKTFDALSDGEVQDRLERAAATFAELRRTSYAERAGWMRATADLLDAEVEQIAALMTLEMGKTLDKKEVWVRSDLRLIFALDDGQVLDESIEQLNKIIA